MVSQWAHSRTAALLLAAIFSNMKLQIWFFPNKKLYQHLQCIIIHIISSCCCRITFMLKQTGSNPCFSGILHNMMTHQRYLQTDFWPNLEADCFMYVSHNKPIVHHCGMLTVMRWLFTLQRQHGWLWRLEPAQQRRRTISQQHSTPWGEVKHSYPQSVVSAPQNPVMHTARWCSTQTQTGQYTQTPWDY